VAIECKDPAFASPLFDRLAPWMDQISYTGTTVDGPISYYLGGLAAVLERYDDANAYFERATEYCQRAGAQYFGAKTKLQWGVALLSRDHAGDREWADGLLGQAYDLAAAKGYQRIATRAAEAIAGLSQRH
jgi:hypothetical protein